MRSRVVPIAALLLVATSARAQVWDNETERRILYGCVAGFALVDLGFTIHDIAARARDRVPGPRAATLETGLATIQGSFALTALVAGARGWPGPDGERRADPLLAAAGAGSLAWAAILGVHGLWALGRQPVRAQLPRPRMALAPLFLDGGAGFVVAGRF